MQYYSEHDLLEINNEFQNLKKNKMSVNEYTANFTENMKLVLNLVPNELFEVKKVCYGTTSELWTNSEASNYPENSHLGS